MSARTEKLTAEQRVRYARQISLAEVGEAGQLALCGLAVRVPTQAPSGVLAGAAEVLSLYLERAGLSLCASEVTSAEELMVEHRVSREPSLPAPRTLAQLAGRPELELVASYLCASFEAVETLKAALALGEPASLPASLVLSTEHVAGDHAP